LQHFRNTKLNLNTKEPPDFVRGSSNFWQDAMIDGDLALFSGKIAFFCGLGGTRTCDLTDVNGAF
jgi:hypothetical protein